MTSVHVPYFIIILMVVQLVGGGSTAEPIADASTRQPFTIDDYFKIKRFKELSLSSDGKLIAYIVEFQSMEENKSVRRVYISGTASGAEPELIGDIQDARKLAWIPGRPELAFLSSRNGSVHVFAFDVQSMTVRQYTEGKTSVAQFWFSPDGQTLAYVAQRAPEKKSSLYEQFQTGEKGILVDSNTASVYNFVNPDWPDLTLRPSRNLWVAITGKSSFQVEISGNVTELHWSSDSKSASVTYVADDIPSTLGSDGRTSLGVYDVSSDQFRLLYAAYPPTKGQAGRSYAGGEWIPDDNKILVRRTTETDLWVSRGVPDWAIIDLSKSKKFEDSKQTWQEIELYGAHAFFPKDSTQVYVNKIDQAISSLYLLKPSGVVIQPDITRDVNDSIIFFQFSTDFEHAAFVNESLTHPPEIYIWSEEHGAQQLTELNEILAHRIMPTVREVSWKSIDGTDVHGWLMEPVRGSRKPWPLITFVHGGPGFPMLNRFANYFPYWPYPFEVYAARGIAVFMPNYRGTMTYGRRFATPSMMNGEPVDDIVSGVQHLIEDGVANPKRLAISGQSHGAWLGSLVMAQAKIFRVGSFAEGTGNNIVTYSLMSGELNRLVHDVVYRHSLYDDPSHYIELSPDLQFNDIDTAVLFEAGNRSLAINMLGSAKAARNSGMPTEFVVYPKTAHSLSTPQLQSESAERNLDWFLFWLNSEEDPNPMKAEQYERWRKLRLAREKSN